MDTINVYQTSHKLYAKYTYMHYTFHGSKNLVKVTIRCGISQTIQSTKHAIQK